ncbi:MAG: hypothetical protein GX772_07600 [Alcaligenaceae bacterium]|nr:hypothetical protein [Alcaligenaceae bacterium]
MKRLLLVSVFALAACQTGAPPENRPEPVAQEAQNRQDPCGAGKFGHLVGTAGDQVKDSMFPPRTRVLRPGMVMTMDYRGDRLNVVINEAGQVDRVYCG